MEKDMKNNVYMCIHIEEFCCMAEINTHVNVCVNQLYFSEIKRNQSLSHTHT